MAAEAKSQVRGFSWGVSGKAPDTNSTRAGVF